MTNHEKAELDRYLTAEPDCDPPDYEPEEEEDPTQQPGYAEWHAKQWKPILHTCGHVVKRYAPTWLHEANMQKGKCPECACQWCGEPPHAGRACHDPFADDQP